MPLWVAGYLFPLHVCAEPGQSLVWSNISKHVRWSRLGITLNREHLEKERFCCSNERPKYSLLSIILLYTIRRGANSFSGLYSRGLQLCLFLSVNVYFMEKWLWLMWLLSEKLNNGCRQEQGPQDRRQERCQEEDCWSFHQEGLVSCYYYCLKTVKLKLKVLIWFCFLMKEIGRLGKSTEIFVIWVSCVIRYLN